MEERIKQKIVENLKPDHFELINESALHAGHAGDDGSGQTHFKLIVVSEAFAEHNRIQRHRMVFSTIENLFPQGIHAFSLVALTPQEFSQK